MIISLFRVLDSLVYRIMSIKLCFISIKMKRVHPSQTLSSSRSLLSHEYFLCESHPHFRKFSDEATSRDLPLQLFLCPFLGRQVPPPGPILVPHPHSVVPHLPPFSSPRALFLDTFWHQRQPVGCLGPVIVLGFWIVIFRIVIPWIVIVDRRRLSLIDNRPPWLCRDRLAGVAGVNIFHKTIMYFWKRVDKL